MKNDSMSLLKGKYTRSLKNFGRMNSIVWAVVLLIVLLVGTSYNRIAQNITQNKVASLLSTNIMSNSSQDQANLIIKKIKSFDNVVFVYNVPSQVYLPFKYSEGDNMVEIIPVPSKEAAYFNISKIEDNVVYVSNDETTKQQFASMYFAKNSIGSQLGLKFVYTNGIFPLDLNGTFVVSDTTYQRIQSLYEKSSNKTIIAGNGMTRFFIGAKNPSETVSIYNKIKTTFPKYGFQVFALGGSIQGMLLTSRRVTYLLLGIAGLLLILGIILNIRNLRQLFQKYNRDFILLYIKGMSPKAIFRLISRQIFRVYIINVLIAFIFGNALGIISAQLLFGKLEWLQFVEVNFFILILAILVIIGSCLLNIRKMKSILSEKSVMTALRSR